MSDNEPQLVLADDEKFVLSPSVYDKLKMTVVVILPMVSTLYFALGNIWGFPNVEKVVGTLAAIAAGLGAIVSASAKRYKNSDNRFDGLIVPTTDGGGLAAASMELKNDPETVLANQKEVTFKVSPPIRK